jgi:3-hydroxyacyl-[acyl-carrier-protein] dehydratase
VLEHAQLHALLPHGHPTLLVDRVAVEADGSAVGTKAITASEPCYAGLPKDADAASYAYPASLLLESFGQTAAVLWLTRAGRVSDASVLMLVGARNCRLEGRAYPGDVLRHVTRIDQIVGDNVFVEGETFVGNRRIVVVESMMAAVRDRSATLGRQDVNGVSSSHESDDPLGASRPSRRRTKGDD